MKFPLPFDTRSIIENNNVLSKTSNLGLLFNKYVHSWQNGWQMKEEDSKKFRDSIAKMTFAKDHIANLLLRQKAMIQAFQSSGWQIFSFEAITDSRLIIGLGGTSVIETGMTLHPLYGFPYLPGSGLKGLARAYVEIAEEPKPAGDDLRKVFGSEDKAQHSDSNRQGKVFFMDGLPTQFPKLELDIMNPHYGEYYRGEKPPADYLNPVPVTFLAVAPGQKFYFALYSRNENLLIKAKQWLTSGLSELGAGGKTNVGYGYFRDFKDMIIENRVIDPKKEQDEKIDNLHERVKKVKNPETFTNFIQGIKEAEIEAFSTISFKGVGSIINIGLLSALESAEASDKIKKIIAQKMLEVCKEPDKKYPEKFEKYKKLQAMAGLNDAQ